jgi:DNA-binding NarL/FixJ family response regulator
MTTLFGDKSLRGEAKRGTSRRGASISRPSAATPRRPSDTKSRAPLRLAIATQPTLFRDALSRLLSREKDFQVVGQGWEENQVAEVLTREKPRILVFDYEALGANSEGIISRLRRLAPETRILVMATRSGDETAERVLRAGASGLVGKQLDLDTLIRAIRAVAAGEVWANRRTTALTLAHLTDFSATASVPRRQLTEREQQIVDGVTRGLRNKEIARHLSISESTVKSHLNNIFQKLGLEGRFALAMVDRRSQQS